jgi:hypothetical protein
MGSADVHCALRFGDGLSHDLHRRGWLITARLAPDRPMAHVWALGIIGLFAAVAGTVATWNAGPEFGPKWYPLALVALALPSVWAGGKLARRATAEN